MPGMLKYKYKTSLKDWEIGKPMAIVADSEGQHAKISNVTLIGGLHSDIDAWHTAFATLNTQDDRCLMTSWCSAGRSHLIQFTLQLLPASLIIPHLRLASIHMWHTTGSIIMLEVTIRAEEQQDFPPLYFLSPCCTFLCICSIIVMGRMSTGSLCYSFHS